MLELLAPAGSPEAVTAAVQAGADAVYLGYGDFNARRNAKNFSLEELAAAVSYCHVRGAKVFLTLNTLVSDRELPAAARTAAEAAEAGVDAVLIQDLGVLRMLRQVAPRLAIHGSTQLTVHSLDGVRRCAELGMARVVLSRELSRDAIEHICLNSPIEIETFVHGALCMCYSGQCFFSSVIGGRSGNRGLCAQPCRLKYGWGERADANPLSLKDMSLAGHIQELKKLGVKCLKIEGRMKRPEYVSVVTGIYARAIRESREPTPEEQREMEAVRAIVESKNTDPTQRIAVFCGPGNNGGDGITAARILLEEGYRVRAFLVGGREKMTPDAKAMEARLVEAGGVLEPLDREDRRLAAWLGTCDCYVDALFGVGLKRPLEGDFLAAVKWMNGRRAPVVSCDLPSGVVVGFVCVRNI